MTCEGEGHGTLIQFGFVRCLHEMVGLPCDVTMCVD